MSATKAQLLKAIIRTAALTHWRHHNARLPIAANATPVGWTDEFTPEPVSGRGPGDVATMPRANLSVSSAASQAGVPCLHEREQ